MRQLFACFLILISGAVYAHPGIHARIESLTRAIEASPDESLLYLRRAAEYSRHNESAKALADFRLAEELGAEIHLELGKHHYRHAEYEQALHSFKAYLERVPDHPDVLIQLARVYDRLDQQEASERAFRSYIDASSTLQPGDILAAAEVVSRKDMDDALKLIDLGISKVGNVAQLQRAAIGYELALENHESAVQRWLSLEDALGKSASWQIELSRYLMLAGQYEQALEWLGKASKIIANSRSVPANVTLEEKIEALTLQVLKRQGQAFTNPSISSANRSG